MKPKVWRTMFSLPNAGYFVWEVMECDPGITEEHTIKYPNTFMLLREGTYITVPNCVHFWNEKDATDYTYASDFPEFLETIVIP